MLRLPVVTETRKDFLLDRIAKSESKVTFTCTRGEPCITVPKYKIMGGDNMKDNTPLDLGAYTLNGVKWWLCFLPVELTWVKSSQDFVVRTLYFFEIRGNHYYAVDIRSEQRAGCFTERIGTPKQNGHISLFSHRVDEAYMEVRRIEDGR